MEPGKNLLLLESDRQNALEIQRFLKLSPYSFSLNHFAVLDEASGSLKTQKPDAILIDSAYVHQAEFAAFRKQATLYGIPIIMLSNTNGSELVRQAKMAGASDYLLKNKINLFHLQKIILNALKVNAAESKLNKSFLEFENEKQVLLNLLDKSDSAMLILNERDVMLFANKPAHKLLADETVTAGLVSYLHYRKLDDADEVLQIKTGAKVVVSLKICKLVWNNEKANLFVLEKLKPGKENTGFESGENAQLLLLNSISDNILLVRDGLILFANKAALFFLKLKMIDLQHKKYSDFFEHVGDESSQSIREVLEGTERESMFQPADGGAKRELRTFTKTVSLQEEVYTMISFSAINDNGNEGAVTGDKNFTNDGLLTLASHDLREPVRTMLNYIQLVSENINNSKYDAAREYADFAKSAADRMEKLLSDLKIYIGLNEHAFKPAKVSLKNCVNDVMKRLKVEIEQSSAEVNIAELPEIKADKELVEKLIYCLLDNALKFRKKGKAPVIDIGFDKYEGRYLFCVRDNGIGIAKKYHGKVFEIFERLNRVDLYPGNGLGLAICKKVIDMHDGKIWVESLPGFGSSFYFMLDGG